MEIEMATDYDSPRKTDDDLSEDSLQELQARRADKSTGIIDEDLDAETRTRLMARLARLLGVSARGAKVHGMATGRWLTDVFADIAPRIPIRDLETLSRHHDGLLGERLADDLVRTASNATTAV